MGIENGVRFFKKVVEKDQCFVQVKPTFNERKKLNLYIYLHFECTQDKNGIHVPNLCVAHRVCQHCDHLTIDQTYSHCDHSGPRRHLLRGPETLKQFTE